MDIIGFALGTALGVGGMIAKEKIMDAPSNKNIQDDLDTLSDENEKLRKRCKADERRIEDLLSEIQKLKKENFRQSDDVDDYEDIIASLQAKLRKAQAQIDELTREKKELEKACESYELELKELKKQ